MRGSGVDVDGLHYASGMGGIVTRLGDDCGHLGCLIDWNLNRLESAGENILVLVEER